MRSPAKQTMRAAALAAALTTALAASACGSGGGGGANVTLPERSTTTTAEGSTTTTGRETTTTTERTTTTTGGSTTTSDRSTTTTSEPATTTTSEATTTTTRPATTTTTERTTTTTERETTTTTEAATTTSPTNIDGTPVSSSSGSSPWLWIAAIALLVIAVAVALFGILRSRRSARARWLWNARDVAARSTETAQRLDQAAAVLGGPAGADRQVWLDANETLGGLATSAGALVADAPDVPGDPEGTNTMATSLESLRNDLTVLRTATAEAERTRFELVGPTTEQLDFASQSVRRAAAAVVTDAHAVSAAADRIEPPKPNPPVR